MSEVSRTRNELFQSSSLFSVSQVFALVAHISTQVWKIILSCNLFLQKPFWISFWSSFASFCSLRLFSYITSCFVLHRSCNPLCCSRKQTNPTSSENSRDVSSSGLWHLSTRLHKLAVLLFPAWDLKKCSLPRSSEALISDEMTKISNLFVYVISSLKYISQWSAGLAQ